MPYEEDFGDNDLERIVEDEGETPGAEESKEADDTEDVERRVIKPKKRVLQPRPKLDPQRLTGPRGIGILESVFKDVKFGGNGHEIKDLNLTISRLEHWAHRLFPRMTFDDCIDRIEDLGAKRGVSTYVTKIRLDMEEVLSEPRTVFDVEEVVDEQRAVSPVQNDPFDLLLNSTPQPPKTKLTLTEEQRARMLLNRQMAEERRMARMKANKEQNISPINYIS